MNKQERRINAWVEQGIISRQQANDILQFEGSRQGSSFAVIGFAALGVVIVSMGLIALIASHWYQIPDSVKITVDFIGLMLLGVFCFVARQSDRTLLFEGLLLFFIFFLLASIGLVGQIYHLHGYLADSLLFWSVLSFPAALFSATVVTPFIWVSVFLPSLLAKVLDYAYESFGFYKCAYTCAFITLPIICGMVAISLRFFREKVSNWHRAFAFWTMISGSMMVVLADINTLIRAQCYNEVFILPALILIVISVTWIHATEIFSYFQKTLVTFALVVYLLFMHFSFFAGRIELLGAAFTIFLCFLAAVYCASCQYRKWFHFFTFLIACRFFIVYLRHIHGLASTGVGLILSGGLIILLVFCWNRYSRPLLNKMTEMSK